MRIQKRLLAGILASTMAFSGGIAIAQDATPGASPVAERPDLSLVNTEGDLVAMAEMIETEEGVHIRVWNDEDSGLEPGEHGIHIHEFGLCTPTEGDTPFADAGGHFNPTGAPHGGPDEQDSHAGDLGNLTVEEDGTIDFETTTNKVTLVPGGENSLADEDGSALVIHANPDDLETDPSGESGTRVACRAIFPHSSAMSSSPVPSPVVAESTPEN